MFRWPYNAYYVVASIVLWLGFLAAVVAEAWGKAAGWPMPALVALALTPSVTVVIQFVMVLRLFDGQDKFVRALTAKRMLAAAGALVVIVTAWGALEGVVHLPHAPLWLVYPLFWGLFGMATPLIRGTTA